jgi:hypothetical protein
MDMDTGRKKKPPKPTRAQIEDRFDIPYADTLFTYQEAKKKMRPDPIGTVRQLNLFELMYFNFMQDYYKEIPTIRAKKHYFTAPPKTWLQRYSQFTPPTTFYDDIDLLLTFAEQHCPNAERNNWRKVL